MLTIWKFIVGQSVTHMLRIAPYGLVVVAPGILRGYRNMPSSHEEHLIKVYNVAVVIWVYNIINFRTR